MGWNHEATEVLLANGVDRSDLSDSLRWWKTTGRVCKATDKELASIVRQVGTHIEHPWNPAIVLGRKAAVERYLNPLRRERKPATALRDILKELAR
jgi:hypothetical protein